MKMRMCSCRWSALARPQGAIKVEKTRMKGPDVLVAKLSGAVSGQAAVVKYKKDFYFVPPKGHGETRKVPADYLTDGLHTGVLEMEVMREMKAAKPAPRKPAKASKPSRKR